MISEIIIPKLGATGGDVVIDQWLVRIGDFVTAGAPILTITTDKATVELEAFRSGFLRGQLVRSGETIEIGTAVALLADAVDEPLGEYEGKVVDEGRFAKERFARERLVTNDERASEKRETGNEKAVDTPIETVAESAMPAASKAKPRKKKISNRKSKIKNLPADLLLSMFRRMSLIRRFEDTLYQLFLQGLVPGTLHQYQGQEAVAVGVCFALRDDDVMFSTHRPVGHFLAKGSAARGIAAEIWGKETGCAGGKGGQMHLTDMSVGAPPSNAIVGANIPIATGAALAFQLRGQDRVAVSFFGDGATNIGAFHEGINLAAVKNAPVLFVCENNQYAASTHISLTARVTDLAARADGYGIPGVIVDGMDVVAVYQAATDAIARARSGEGPTFLECKTYRYMGHSRGDPGGYRTKQELAEWRGNDPLQKCRTLLTESYGIEATTLDAMEAETQQEVEDAVAFARSSPDPNPTSLTEHIYA